jgi:hydrogenase assembly chaperone HypC/HupF
MCLQIPGKVISLNKSVAVIDYEIEKREALVADVPVNIGDWVIVVGKFIVDIVPEEAAKESLALWKRTMQH